MKYEDEIITIKLSRGELAVSLGEQGLMVKNWSKLKSALKSELLNETSGRGDGHSGVSELGDVLLNRIIDRHGKSECGISDKPDRGRRECWPFEEAWFTGINKEIAEQKEPQQ